MTAPSPKVSVVITAFNREGTIIAAIQSCLDQTYPVSEVLVVDDGSSDNTLKYASSTGDERVKVFSRHLNGGQCAAANDGINAATGDLIAFLDSDDIWLPTKLEQQVQLWSENVERTLIVVYCPVLVGRGNKRQFSLPNRQLRRRERVGDYLLYRGGLIQTSTILCPRELLASVRYDERTRRHTDYGLVLRLEAAGAHFVMCRDALVVWNQDNDGSRVSRSHNAEQSSQWLHYHRRYLSVRARTAFKASTLAPAEGRLGQMILSRLLSIALGAFSVSNIVRKTARRIRVLMDED